MERTSLGLVARLVAALVAAISLAESPACAQVPCRYEVRFVDADYCNGSDTSPLFPNAINDQDPPVAVGSFRPCAFSNDRPFYWKSNEPEITLMGVPPGKSVGSAADINNVIGKQHGVGQIIVNYFVSYLWDDGEWIEIPPPPGEAEISPNAIASDQLIVAGTSSQDTFHAARWDGNVSEVLKLPYGQHQFGNGISPDGSKIVGYMQQTASMQRAFVWEAGHVIDPGWLPESTVTDFAAVNDFGDATGRAVVPDPVGRCHSIAHAVVWRENELIDIGTLPQWRRSFGLSIANDRTVVGTCTTLGCCNCGSTTAFVWSYQTGMQKLDDITDLPPDTRLRGTADINERGEILCSAGMGAQSVSAVLIPLPRDGDVNCDGFVDLHDLVQVIQSWGPCRGCQADLTEDWIVNVDDLLQVINNWNP